MGGDFDTGDEMKVAPVKHLIEGSNTVARPARRSILVALGASLGMFVSGCVAYAGGPAPHAPEDGYWWYHPDGYWLSYDSSLGLYVVVGWPFFYYRDGIFFQYYRGHWYRSTHLRGRPWRPWPHTRLPPGLRRYRTKPPWREPARRGRQFENRGRTGPGREQRRGYRRMPWERK